MKDQTVSLRIYLFSQSVLSTEWLSLLGDKYYQSLNFSWVFTEKLDEANVIAWDGVVTPKLQHYEKLLTQKLKSGAVLFLQSDMRTLTEQNPFVSFLSLVDLNYVELSGWSLLPEEMLMALTICQQKLNHV